MCEYIRALARVCVCAYVWTRTPAHASLVSIFFHFSRFYSSLLSFIILLPFHATFLSVLIGRKESSLFSFVHFIAFSFCGVTLSFFKLFSMFSYSTFLFFPLYLFTLYDYLPLAIFFRFIFYFFLRNHIHTVFPFSCILDYFVFLLLLPTLPLIKFLPCMHFFYYFPILLCRSIFVSLFFHLYLFSFFLHQFRSFLTFFYNSILFT